MNKTTKSSFMISIELFSRTSTKFVEDEPDELHLEATEIHLTKNNNNNNNNNKNIQISRAP